MFKPLEREELNQISLTGVRSIVLLGLLIATPLSLKEIRQAFLEINVIEETNSDDTIRIDINTLKSFGCKLTRPTRKNGYKYTLTSHPFALKITEDDIKYFKKVYNRLKAEADIKTLLDLDELVHKIAQHLCDEKMKEKFIGITALKHLNLNIIKELREDCKYEKTLEILYKKPPSEKSYHKEVVAQKLVFQNDQVYLHCFDKKAFRPIVLNVKRITSIISRRFKGCAPEAKGLCIKFLLKDYNVDQLTKEEFIIEQTENSYLIEGYYYNEFLALQRMLSFGANCTVIEPQNFREKIIEKLKEMRDIYGK